MGVGAPCSRTPPDEGGNRRAAFRSAAPNGTARAVEPVGARATVG